MAPHAENEVAAVEEKTTNSDKSQVVDKNQGKAKNKSKGKGKGETRERIQRLDQLYSTKKRQTYFVPTPTSRADQEKPGQTSHVVLKVRRIICDKGFPTGTEVDIKSTLLKDVLTEIFEGVEGLTLNESPPVASPELLFHARQKLSDRIKAEEAKASPNKALIDELGVAVQFVAEHFSSTLETLDCMSAQNEITFNLLWTLFPAKTTVYTKSNLLQAHQVLKLHKGDYGASNGAKFFDLDMRLLSHDGEKMGWAEKSMRIWQFEGAKKVYNLTCFPLAHHPEQESIQAELKTRGKLYVELLNAPHGTCQEYLGPAVTENRCVMVENEYKKVIFHISGRIMLDSSSFGQLNEYTDLLRPTIENEVNAASLSDADYTYCNHYVGGFAFRQKKWCLFAISQLNPVVWNPNAFSKLVMDPQKRNLIHTLVKSHRNGADTFDDVVSGKGKGLVGLLSGNPGVGKTLTAEVISEVSKRPLYMLSAGELGIHVEDVERRLDMVLEVTRIWGCVLLIDEADVFLQERDGLNVERNALVSVFLRRLEYFQGVLIMTTNRKRTIDAAFDSRIHFKLHYGDLDVASRSAIWKNCIDSVPAAVSTSGISEKDIQQLAALKLNGRQIKNAVACAVSIAMEEKVALSVEGIQVILDMDGDDESEG